MLRGIILESYLTKQAVHNRAKEAVGKSVLELNGGESIKQSKSSVGDAFENWFGKKKTVIVNQIWQRLGWNLRQLHLKS